MNLLLLWSIPLILIGDVIACLHVFFLSSFEYSIYEEK